MTVRDVLKRYWPWIIPLGFLTLTITGVRMPGFVSQAQRRKWEQLKNEGRVTQEQFDTRAVETPDTIPERATPRQRTVGPSRAPDAAKFNDRRY